MGDVRLGVKLFLGVDAAFDLATGNGFDNCGNACQKIVLEFFPLNAVIELRFDSRRAFNQRAIGTLGDFVTHQNANFVQFLPLAI